MTVPAPARSVFPTPDDALPADDPACWAPPFPAERARDAPDEPCARFEELEVLLRDALERVPLLLRELVDLAPVLLDFARVLLDFARVVLDFARVVLGFFAEPLDPLRDLDVPLALRDDPLEEVLRCVLGEPDERELA
jgi:hypothetical protein